MLFCWLHLEETSEQAERVKQKITLSDSSKKFKYKRCSERGFQCKGSSICALFHMFVAAFFSKHLVIQSHLKIFIQVEKESVQNKDKDTITAILVTVAV